MKDWALEKVSDSYKIYVLYKGHHFVSDSGAKVLCYDKEIQVIFFEKYNIAQGRRKVHKSGVALAIRG